MKIKQHYPINLDNIERKPVLADMSVIIPTLGRSILEKCMSLLAFAKTWPAKLIVVDQGRKRTAQEWCELLNNLGLITSYLPSLEVGKSAGINRGLELVETSYLAIIDDDCFPDIDWLEKMYGRLLANPGSIVTGRVEPAGDVEVEFSAVTSFTPKIYRGPQYWIQPLIGGNFGTSMQVVEKVGNFDESQLFLKSAEDKDWGYRALRLGIPILYDPSIVVYHYNWRNNRNLRANRYFEYSRGMGSFYGKHLRTGDMIIFLQAIRDLVRGPVRWVRGVVNRDQDMIDRGRADTLELLPGIADGLRRGKMP